MKGTLNTGKMRQWGNCWPC